MQRFFSLSPFPDGRPGFGLLVLRVVAALAAIALVLARLAGSTALEMLGGALLLASSLTVLVGLLTTGSATLLAIILTWFWLPVHTEAMVLSNSPAVLLTIADAIAISLLGPGAFSLDARLFGPREIVVPREPRNLRD